MQLNNLVIIPIPSSGYDKLDYKEPLSPSPCKNMSRNMSMRDEIPWKKSHSAFKKFKGKKDKENKSAKNSQSNIPFFQPDQQQELLNKNFSLVDNDINFSLLNSQNGQVFKTQQTYDYYDPNQAPFFQYGITYQYLPKQGRVHIIQDELESINSLKRNETQKLKRQISKKEKSAQQDPDKQNNIKLQMAENNQSIKPFSTEYFNDPFIIIKASDKRGQFLQSIIRNQHFKKEEYRKNKFIKKSVKGYSKASSIHSYSIYSNQNSDQIKRQHYSSSDQKSDDYGCNQLPIIEFDLCGHIKSSICEQQKNQDMANLHIYEVRDDSQLFQKIKPYQRNLEILKQYEFDPTKIQEKKSEADKNDIYQNQGDQPFEVKPEQKQ